MKKLLFLLTILCSASISALYAQQNDMSTSVNNFRKNEIAVDVSSLAFMRLPHFTYERLLDEEMGLGIRALYNPFMVGGASPSFVGPYFRWYFFGRKSLQKSYASGLFLELNSAFGHMKEEVTRRYSNGTEGELRFGVGMGLGLGYKYVNTKGWSFQIYLAGGRSISDSQIGYFIPAIALGRRF
ncbi:MAG: hypothetical protein Q3998_06600 [Porphyromonas sp.]|nr:hypothetical protein [Porphyromonas sp.]